VRGQASRITREANDLSKQLLNADRQFANAFSGRLRDRVGDGSRGPDIGKLTNPLEARRQNHLETRGKRNWSGPAGRTGAEPVCVSFVAELFT
jgi:hypothetical protein